MDELVLAPGIPVMSQDGTELLVATNLRIEKLDDPEEYIIRANRDQVVARYTGDGIARGALQNLAYKCKAHYF